MGQGTNLERRKTQTINGGWNGCILIIWTHIHRIITKPTTFYSFFQFLRNIFYRKKKPNIPLISFFRSLRKEIHDDIKKRIFIFPKKPTSFCRFFRLSELIFYQKKILKIPKFLIFCLIYMESFSIFFDFFLFFIQFLFRFTYKFEPYRFTCEFKLCRFTCKSEPYRFTYKFDIYID